MGPINIKNFNAEWVVRWRMVIKYFAPKLLYIEGANNIVADAFSRLEVSNTKPQKKKLFLFSKILATNNQT